MVNSAGSKCSASVWPQLCDSVIQFQTSAVMMPPSVVLLRWICSGQRGRGRMPERRVPPIRQEGLCFRRQSSVTGAGHRGEPTYTPPTAIGVSVCVPRDGMLLEPALLRSDVRTLGLPWRFLNFCREMSSSETRNRTCRAHVLMFLYFATCQHTTNSFESAGPGKAMHTENPGRAPRKHWHARC